MKLEPRAEILGGAGQGSAGRTGISWISWLQLGTISWVGDSVIVLGSPDNNDLRGPGGTDAVCCASLTSSVTLAVSPVLSEPRAAGPPRRDK